MQEAAPSISSKISEENLSVTAATRNDMVVVPRSGSYRREYRLVEVTEEELLIETQPPIHYIRRYFVAKFRALCEQDGEFRHP